MEGARSTLSRGRGWRGGVALGVLVASMLLAAPACAATFDRANVVSDEVFRASGSMSQTGVQEFLDGMPGVLKTYTAPDHTSVRKPASRIIWEAAQAWNISPMVILSMLQKEQGLLTMVAPTPDRLTEAMGCGVYPGSTNTYPGFGNQVWHGTRKLATYEFTYHWRPGTWIRVNGVRIVPASAATFSMYTYNPSFSGNSVFNDVYRRYFGDPTGTARFKPVYRFVSRANGTYIFTASQRERISLRSGLSKAWAYQGVSFSIDTSSSANTSPLYRLYNKTTGKYYYTASIGEMNRVIRSSGRRYKLNSIVCRVSTVAGSGSPVYRLRHPRTGACVLAASMAERNRWIRSSGFRTDGIVFYMGG
jgi:hypothetical protein